jgi:hypothetical protein
MSTVQFADMAAYTTWHDGKCAELGIPYPGYNGESGDPAITSQWTTAYVAPLVIDGYHTVTLDDETIAADPVLSTLPTMVIRRGAPGSDVDENGDPVSVIEVVPPEQYEKSLPDTWTDPQTGVTYRSADGATL